MLVVCAKPLDLFDEDLFEDDTDVRFVTAFAATAVVFSSSNCSGGCSAGKSLSSSKCDCVNILEYANKKKKKKKKKSFNLFICLYVPTLI